jgi:hypothetical protein
MERAIPREEDFGGLSRWSSPFLNFVFFANSTVFFVMRVCNKSDFLGMAFIACWGIAGHEKRASRPTKSFLF